MNESASVLNGWRRVAWPASLLLNVFLLAVLGGYFWRTHVLNTAERTPMGRILANVTARLSARDAAAFRAVLQHDEPQLSIAGKQLAESRTELAAALSAEPYDKQRAARALAVWQRSGQSLLSEFGPRLIDAIGAVSPEGRRQLVRNPASE
jgi:uncharacterized membrane protein